MAGTVQPIAALTADDRGPINTIASIILPSLSVLCSVIRMVVRRQKHIRLELDDIVFGVTLCFGITTSIMSHICVRAGLGRHQAKLNDEQVERYFKLFWTTQLLGIVALAGAKLSIVLMFKRIDPVQLGLVAIKWLIPMLPRPWVLSPERCSTHGNVYYVITISNILTDTILSFCILPVLWKLQMKRHTKNIVIWLFVSRFLVCIVDMGRMVVIHKALQSEDQTRSQLLWAVMDQLVIHLSICHATLPRIQIFLSNLQTGLLDLQVPTTYSSAQNSRRFRSKPSRNTDTDSPVTTRSDRRKSNRDSKSRSKHGRWSSLLTQLSTMSQSKASSIAERPLRLQPELGIELSTTVYAGDGESTQSDRKLLQNSLSSNALPGEEWIKEDGECDKEGVRVQKEIRMAYNSV